MNDQARDIIQRHEALTGPIQKVSTKTLEYLGKLREIGYSNPEVKDIGPIQKEIRWVDKDYAAAKEMEQQFNDVHAYFWMRFVPDRRGM